MRTRINFVDNGQDLTYVVTDADPIGTITELPKSCSPAVAKIYKGMAVDLDDNQIGERFNYANPNKGFKVVVTKFIIESINQI